MVQKKAKYKARLSARLTENTTSVADIKFINEKLKSGMSQAVIIREAISAYRKKEKGELVDVTELLKNNNLNDLKISNEEIIEEDDEKNEKLEEEVGKILNGDVF